MQKIKYFILFAITFIILISPVSASTNTYERNDLNNYGVNKKWDMSNSTVLEYAKKTPYVDASEKIYDFGNILTDEEEDTLYQRITSLIEEYNIDIVILTYDLTYYNDSTNEEFATDFYDFNDFGINFKEYSGILFFRNTYSDDPYYDMYSFGDAMLYYTPERMETILDDVYPSISGKNYLYGFNRWLDNVEKYHQMGKSTDYTVDQEKNELVRVKHFNPHLLLNFVISAIVTFIFIIINVKKNKMVALATEASAYLNKESFELTNRNDSLINSVTTHYTEPEHTSSSSSGGHSSIGHSGGGHASGGGRHG